jgi:peptide/nickel transport system substrate-binding protein
MKKRISWLLLSCLMVMVLVLASCGPAVTEEEEEEETVTEEEEEVAEEEEEEEAGGPEMVRDSLGRLVEKPKYGGVFTEGISGPPRHFDEAFGHQGLSWTMYLTNEELTAGDWTRGPTGTGEAAWMYVFQAPEHLTVGRLAESWEIIEPDTMIFHIRQGVHFHDKPPVNGREMTADDVVYSLMRLFTTPTSYHYSAYPWDTHFGETGGITAPDKWTVMVKIAGAQYFFPVYSFVSQHSLIIPHEVIEQYGDMNDWKVSSGTGPFMLVDYVQSSSITYGKNPNYWGKDPFHPENTLPYADGVKQLVVPDFSTRLAAIRTAKIDRLSTNWEEAEDLMRTNPELEYLRYVSGDAFTIQMRVDKPELPIYDVRVRQALAMAVNQQEIADDYYGGNAYLLAYPVGPIPEYANARVELDELPESIREQFEYHPDKAKQLLAEAGYPNGFKTEVLAVPGYVDLLAIVQAYWADIGVDLEIVVKETGAYWSLGFQMKHEQMFVFAPGGYLPFRFHAVMPNNVYNFSGIDNPTVTEIFRRMDANYFDTPERDRIMREEFYPAALGEVFQIELPGTYAYNFWQPWVKAYSGEISIGKKNNYYQMYLWLDQDLKEEMTGRR